MLSIVLQAGSFPQDSMAGQAGTMGPIGIPIPREVGERPVGYIFNRTMAPGQ